MTPAHRLVCRTALALALLATTVFADPAPPDHRGWGWLIERLVADGVARPEVERAFDDPRIAPFDGLDFGLGGQEPRSLYRKFLRPPSVAAARTCRAHYAHELDAAAAAEGVPASVLAAIMSIESACGRHTGEHLILERLARLAMANEPANLRRNLDRLTLLDDDERAARVRARARELDATFYPEVRAVFALAGRLGVDPVTIRGSGSGAFGTPQFLPTSYLAHGADGDGDGRVDLYDPADASRSCAAYLAGNGWRPGLSPSERRRVLWAYNHSEAYIDTVLALARAIDGPPPPPPRRRAKAVRRTTVRAATKPPAPGGPQNAYGGSRRRS